MFESANPVRAISEFKTMRIEESGTTTYFGVAAQGTATATAKWQIKRLIDDGAGNITIEWADGNAEFDNIWDNRAGLSYS